MGAREEEARKVTESETKEWHADFEAAQRRPLETRLKYAFIRTCKPVLDDGGVRVFDTMKEYREWCNEALPEWLGHPRAQGTSSCSQPPNVRQADARIAAEAEGAPTAR